jgi:hypothetical protein
LDKEYKIYRLVHNGDIIYVGQTTKTLARRKSCGYKHIPFYKECSIELIETTTDITRETIWIMLYMAMGCELLNKRRGVLTEDDRIEIRNKNYDNNKYAIVEKRKEYMKDYYQKNKKIFKIRGVKYRTKICKN